MTDQPTRLRRGTIRLLAGYPPPPPPGGYPPPPPRVDIRRHRRRAVIRRLRIRAAIRHPGRRARISAAAPTTGAALPKEAYTPWFTRVVGYIIDVLPGGRGDRYRAGIAFGTADNQCISNGGEYDYGVYCTSNMTAFGMIVYILAYALAFAYWIWNWGYRQGTTGQSIGKSVMKFKVISEKTGPANRFRLVDRASDRSRRRLARLLHRVAVPAVGRQEADSRRQDHVDDLCAGGTGGAQPAAAATAATTTAVTRLIGRR